MTDAIDLTPEQRKTLNDLLCRFLPNVAVWAYGSRVKWTAHSNSDLDLVAFTVPAQRAQVADLKDALAESNLPFPVDLHVWDDVPERFREIIRNEYVVLQEAKEPERKTGIAGEWKNVALEDAADELTVGYVGPMASEYVDDGIPFLRSLNVEPLRINKNDLKFITPEFHQRIRKSRLTPGDVVIVRTGKPGACSVIPEWLTDANCSDLVIVRCGKDLNNRFLAYYVNTVASGHISAHLVGAVQQHFNVGSARTLRINLPPFAEQKAIAHILGTLDDKIELNRRMNETLEAMARALFKSWFVDFDPIRAKAEGRETGLPEHLADLFSDSFEDSELGEIPRGWKRRSIYEIADVVYGAPFASSQFNTEGIGEPLIRIRDLADESPGVWTPEIHPKGYKVRPGDIVVGMDGEFRAYLWGGAEAWLNQRVCVFLPKGGYSAAFVRNSIIEPLAHIENTETATTVIHLGKSDIDRFCVVTPTAPILAAFNQCCQPWYDRIVAAKHESRTLSALRDALLPKLICGELRVKDAERFIETV